jgi:hypothetical protein
MTMRRDRMRWKNLFMELVSWVGLAGMAACSSSEEAPGGGRVAHPVTVNPGTGGPPGTAAPPPSTSNAPRPSSAWVTPPPADSRPRRLNSEIYEQYRGLKPSPEDKAILDDCPERAWSMYVPKRACTSDHECGDGFCDRDRCAAIWTCGERHGQRCEKDMQCGVLCVDGRCRSCASDAECVNRLQTSDARCTPNRDHVGARSCRTLVLSIPPTVDASDPPAVTVGAEEAK